MELTKRAYSIGHSASVHEIKKPFHFEIGSSIISWFIQWKTDTYKNVTFVMLPFLLKTI